MTTPAIPPLELLKQYGDLLEREMFQDVDFAAHFSAYPSVWAQYILPNRNTKLPTLATKPWMSLAEHNYTAIVRCWNVRSAYQRITGICTQIAARDASGALILELQEVLVAFFSCAGAAIDNLYRAFAVDPVRSTAAGDHALYGKTFGWGSLKWVYERRTQNVHKVLVPCYESGGVPCFDAALFVDAETHWDQAKGVKIESIADFMDRIWKEFADQMNGAWFNLYGQLQQVEKPPSQEVIMGTIKEYEVTWSSGGPSEPGGSPSLNIPPSGSFSSTSGPGA